MSIDTFLNKLLLFNYWLVAMFQNEYIHETRENSVCVLKDSRLTYITN